MNRKHGLWRQDKKAALAFSLFGITVLGLPAAALAQVNALEPAAATPPAPIPALGTPPVQAGTEGDGEASAVPKRAWTIVPRIALRETFTDNVAPGSGKKRSDQVTEIAPGIRIDADTARLKLHFDYNVRQLLYAQNSGRENTQNYLRTFGTLEALDNWLFIDMSGIITQQEISPFGFQSPSDTAINPNRRETSSFGLSPYIKGRLADVADYQVRYNRSTTQSDSGLALDVDVEEWSGTAKGPTPLAKIGWALEASRKSIDYNTGRDNENDRYRGLLSYNLVPEFKVSVSGGQESNNFSSARRETHDTYGYGFDWLPSERTYLSAFREKRFFGYGHTVSAGHRTPLSAFRYADSRDISILPNRLSVIGLGTIHDLMFTQLTSTIPDPAERSRFVDTLLQQYGISPDVVVTREFLTSRVSVQRRQELSYALHGARNVLTLSAVRSEREALGTTTGAADIFTVSRVIRQRGFSINLAHRLTPLSTLVFEAARQNTSGSGGSGISNELNLFQVSFTTRLGPRTSASLAVRRALFDSPTIPYSEKALVAALSAQF